MASSRSGFGYTLGFLLATFFIGATAYLEMHDQFNPCLMCNVQRIFIGLLGLVFLIGALHRPGKIGDILYGIFNLVFAGLGLTVAIRQLMLQHAGSIGCSLTGAGAHSLVNITLSEIIDAIAGHSSSDCGAIQNFLSINMTYWSIGAFVLLTITAICLMFRK